MTLVNLVGEGITDISAAMSLAIIVPTETWCGKLRRKQIKDRREVARIQPYRRTLELADFSRSRLRREARVPVNKGSDRKSFARAYGFLSERWRVGCSQMLMASSRSSMWIDVVCQNILTNRMIRNNGLSKSANGQTSRRFERLWCPGTEAEEKLVQNSITECLPSQPTSGIRDGRRSGRQAFNEPSLR